MKWDDLRIFLAVVRTSNASAAAQLLDVDPSTVQRRIHALELNLGARLFMRTGNRRVLSATGTSVLAAAQDIEKQVAHMHVSVSGHTQQLAGHIRIGVPDGLASVIAVPIVGSFRRLYPSICTEFVTSNLPLALGDSEVDVEIRPTKNPSGELKGRRISRIAFGIYGSKDYLHVGGKQRARAMLEADRFDEFEWIFHDILIYAPGSWIRERVPPTRIAAIANSVLVLRSMAAKGLGLALLPSFLGDDDPNLLCVQTVDPELWGELWLLTHPEASNNVRIRCFLDHAAEQLSLLRPMLEAKAHLAENERQT